MSNCKTLDEAKALARQLAEFGKTTDHPCAFEVVKTRSKPFEVQPFGMHALFKSHKLLHVEPIPA